MGRRDADVGASAAGEAHPGHAAEMLRLLNGFLTVQALHVAATLGLADELAAEARGAEELAAATDAHPDGLRRLMRMLTGAGVLVEQEDGRFALTPLGATLRSEGPESVRDWALFVGLPETWAVWSGLLASVRTGEAAFPAVRGVQLWEYLAAHPDVGDAFHRWMTRQSEQHNAALVASYDFSPFGAIVDVGGGRGSSLAAILRSQPALRGVLLDLPAVVADPAPLVEAGVAGRCEVVGGDMREAVPAGADAYLLKRVLMDWGDDVATTILRNCAAAMSEHGRVLVVELLLPPRNQPSPSRAFDLLMLLNQPGGRIRTEDELAALFAAAGLRLARVIATPSQNWIVEGVRA